MKVENLVDLYHYKEHFKRELDKISSYSTTEKNKETIKKFIDRKKAEGISLAQLLKYIFTIKSFLKTLKKDFELADENDLQNFLLSMENLKPETKRTRFNCLRVFLRYIGKGDIVKIKIKQAKPNIPKILTKEDVQKMIDSCSSLRNKTFIGVLYESGCRIGEILSLKVENIAFDVYGAILIVSGKTGQRRIRIIGYSTWLEEIVKNKTKFERVFDFYYTRAREIIQQACYRARINKRVYPHLFRHSRATHLAKHLTESELREFFGWGKNSKMAGLYVHLSGRDVDEKLLELYGLKPMEKTQVVDKDLVQSLLSTILNLNIEMSKLKKKMDKIEQMGVVNATT